MYKERLKGYELAVLVNDRSLASQVSRNLRSVLDVSVGGQRAKLMASPGVCPQSKLEDRGKYGAAQEDGRESGGDKGRHGAARAVSVRKPPPKMMDTLTGVIGGSKRMQDSIL